MEARKAQDPGPIEQTENQPNPELLKPGFDGSSYTGRGVMRMTSSTIIVALSLLTIARPLIAQDKPDNRDSTPHSIRFVAVQDNVKLEVLDWGGTGRPVILLHGGNRTAHDFDAFAPKLTVCTMSMALLGADAAHPALLNRSMPTTPRYRLGDDVLAAISELALIFQCSWATPLAGKS